MAATIMDRELPDDVVSDILERVPDSVSLFRCSVVCKQWRRLVADPVFLRRRWPENSGQPSLLGFFVQRRRTNFSAQRNLSYRPSPSQAPAFIPAPESSVLGPGRRLLTSFIRDDAGVLDKAKPLAARGGLVLVRVAPRSSENNNILRLCVCNLVTGSLERLPTLDASILDGDGVRGYGLATGADYDDVGPHSHLAHGYSTLFLVLLVGFGKDGHLYLFRFSSAFAGSRRWRTDDCRGPTGGAKLREIGGCRTAAIADGTAEWLFRGPENNRSLYTLNVSLAAGHIAASKLRFDHVSSTVWLCSSDAKPSLLYVRSSWLVIWSRRCEEDGTFAWHPTSFRVLVGNALSRVCAGESSGTVLTVFRSRDSEWAYVLDIQSNSATKVEGWIPSFDNSTVVPFEINWPMFFMSRLGVHQI